MKKAPPSFGGALVLVLLGTDLSVALLALVLISVMLDPGNSKSGHAAPIDRALPAGEFFEAQSVALACFVDGQETARNGSDDFCLATHNPTRGRRGRKRVERQRFAKRSDYLRGTNFLILEHLPNLSHVKLEPIASF